MDPKLLTIPEYPTPKTLLNPKSRVPLPPHQIPFEEKDYSPPRVEADPLMPVPQPVQNIPQGIKNY